MNLLQQFKNYVGENNLFQKEDGLLLAVSGGVDSVVLCYLCKEAGYNFSIAHCNFNLRGEESMRDEAFVTELSKTLGAPFYLKRFETKTYAVEAKISIQVAARGLRYNWFKELLAKSLLEPDEDSLANKNKNSVLRYILTAHHLDDNIETVLMNFFKGTGISGLAGIKPKQTQLIRPLLFALKTALVTYATEHGLCWVEDSSNNETKYTRNFFRHHIIPQLETLYPAVKQNLVQNIVRLTEAETLYQQAITIHKKKLVEYRNGEVHIPVLKLAKAVPVQTILYEVIKDYGFSSQQVPEVMKLLQSESGRYITSGTHRILRNRAWIIISGLKERDQQIIVIEKAHNEKQFDDKVLNVENVLVADFSSNNKWTAVINAQYLKYPLLLRRCKSGDYFYPLGMTKKKKLSRFFIDEKLSKNEKENIWVLEMDRKIVWVVGYRIDNRFKITDAAKPALRLSITFPNNPVPR